MDRKRQWFASRWSIFFVAVALVSAGGCNSSSSGDGGERRAGDAAADSARTRVDVMCMGDLIEKPPEAFHYSFKYTDASTTAEKTADITPQSIDFTITDKSGSHKYHGVRSDEGSWASAVVGLSGLGITTMAARLQTLNRTSAIVSHGTEAINGYNTVKYSIDTTSANSSDKQRFATLFGPGSFDTGTVWMGEDGCAVKLVLDQEEKRHFEMARVKK